MPRFHVNQNRIKFSHQSKQDYSRTTGTNNSFGMLFSIIQLIHTYFYIQSKISPFYLIKVGLNGQ